jgi:cytochrome P450
MSDSVDLIAVDLTDPATFVDGPPHEFLTELRHREPVWWHPDTDRHSGFWVLTRYADVDAVMRQPETFINSKGVTIDPLEEVAAQSQSISEHNQDAEIGQTALSYTDPPHHRMLRHVIAGHFTPRRIGEFRELLIAHARALVDEFAATGGDFISSVAEPYPLRVLAAVLGLPDDTAAALTRFARAASNDPESFAVAATEFLGAIYALAQQRRESPGTDVISAMVTADGEGGALAADRLGGVLIQLAIAGNETTRGAAGHAVRLLADHPEHWRAIVNDPNLIGVAVEEVLRYRPPVHYIRRTVAEPATIGSGEYRQRVETDDVIYLSIASANRDEDVFERADEFDPTITRDRPHLAFGVGEHFCIGAGLARLELRCLLEQLVRAMPKLRPAGAPATPESGLFDMLACLPIAAAFD